FFEGFCAIERAKYAALRVGPVRMAVHGNKNAVGVPGIDNDRGDLLCVTQAEVGPGFSRVGGFIKSVANREVRALQALSASDVQNGGIGGRNRQRADGAGSLLI